VIGNAISQPMIAGHFASLGTKMLPGNSKPPIGPSSPLRQVYPVLTGVTSPFISFARNTRDGRGVIVPVGVTDPVAVGEPVTVTHNLGRVPQRIVALQNDGGAAENPQMTLASGTAPTRTQATISADIIMTNCLVRLE
jgi:hypothetical protein